MLRFRFIFVLAVTALFSFPFYSQPISAGNTIAFEPVRINPQYAGDEPVDLDTDEYLLAYDSSPDLYYPSYSQNGTKWAVRFTSVAPCRIIALEIVTYGEGSGRLHVWRDDDGSPGEEIMTSFIHGLDGDLTRQRINFPDFVYVDTTSFFGGFEYINAAPPYAILDGNGATEQRSIVKSPGGGWNALPNDLNIRAYISYSLGYLIYEPEDFKFTIHADSSTSRAFGMTAIEDSAFVRVYADDVDWITGIFPDSLVLVPGDTQTVRVDFDATDVPPGKYSARINFESETPGIDNSWIPVSMTVWPKLNFKIRNIIPYLAHTGDSLKVETYCINTSDYPLRAWLASALVLPDSTLYGPVFGPVEVNILGYGGFFTTLRHLIPGYAPLGTYQYKLRISPGPGLGRVIAEVDTTFHILSSGHNRINDYSGDWGVLDYNIVDFPFMETDLTAGSVSGSNPKVVVSPNPFNPRTDLGITLVESADILLEVYNLLGQRIEVLADEYLHPGNHVFRWDASEYSSGIYFYKFRAGENVITGRMVFLK
ncbi:MAG: T9SS type A sorting domain-containing protein [candidate division Zixibacteria bacterium]|nr:T9SS type A sorting domain-containing protein [candidate division Zixibacteria bacterium]